MGRIGYFDGVSRKRLGLRESFDAHILAPLQRDVLRYTWLHERYNCQGAQATQRTAAYFEFPSVVAMLTREVRYGIDVGIGRVAVEPFLPTPARFTFSVGDIRVDYRGAGSAAAAEGVKLRLPGAPGLRREYRIGGMRPGQRFNVSASGAGCGALALGTAAVADAAGLLRFSAPGGPGCEVSALAQLAQ